MVADIMDEIYVNLSLGFSICTYENDKNHFRQYDEDDCQTYDEEQSNSSNYVENRRKQNCNA